MNFANLKLYLKNCWVRRSIQEFQGINDELSKLLKDLNNHMSGLETMLQSLEKCNSKLQNYMQFQQVN